MQDGDSYTYIPNKLPAHLDMNAVRTWFRGCGRGFRDGNLRYLLGIAQNSGAGWGDLYEAVLG